MKRKNLEIWNAKSNIQGFHNLRLRKWKIYLPVILTLALMIPLGKAKINPDLNAYLPAGMEARINLDKLEEAFGKTDPVVLIFASQDVLKGNTLMRVSDLSWAFNKVPEISDVISLFDIKSITGDQGFMLVEPAVRRIPSSDTDRESLRNELRGNELAYGHLISDDFRYTLLILDPEEGTADAVLLEKIREQLALHPGVERVYLHGMPYFRYELQRAALHDLALLLPLALAVMILFLYLSFREWKGVFLPLAVVTLSTAATMGLMPMLGWDFSLVAVLVPVMMIAIANNYGVHMMARYQELNANFPDMNMEQITAVVLRTLRRPILFTGLTTIAGILGLVTQIMLPAKQMGVVTAIGISLSLVLSLVFIPAILAGSKKGKAHKSFTRDNQVLLDRWLDLAGRVTTRSPRLMLGIFIVVFVAAGSGLIRLRSGINLENLMPSRHALRTSSRIINEKFGGSKSITLLFEGDLMDPVLLQRLDHDETELEKRIEIGDVTSLATIIRLISKALNDAGDPYFDAIPENRELIAQYLELYMMSGDPGDFEQLVDFNFEKGVLNIQFRADDIRSFNQTLRAVQDQTAGDPDLQLRAGYSLVEKDLAECIVRGQLNSLIFALAAICLLIWIMFRSLIAGFLGSLPLLFTLVCNFGLMGWLGMELNIATALLSSVAIGIGVDYTIHFFWRLRAEVLAGQRLEGAIMHTLKTTGRGIAINALSVMIGFTVLFLSGLAILKAFAFLILFSIMLCLLAALVLIPALSILIRPRFLQKDGILNAVNRNNHLL